MLTLVMGQQLAYETAQGVAGNFYTGGSLGLDFDVVEPVLVFELGTFIGTLSALSPSAPLIQVGIFERAKQKLVPGATANISEVSTTRFSNGAALMQLPHPVLLPAGTYSVVAVGYSSSVPALMLFGSLNASRMVTTDGCPEEIIRGGTFSTYQKAALRFVGSSRRSPSGEDALVYPISADLGPEAKYAAGTFTFGLAGCSLSWTLVTRSGYDSRTALLRVRHVPQSNASFPIRKIVDKNLTITTNVVVLQNTIEASLEVDLSLMNSSAPSWYVTIADCIFFSRFISTSYGIFISS